MKEGKRVRIIMPNNICYHGKIISEDEIFVVIIDKFKEKVRLNKKHIISLTEDYK